MANPTGAELFQAFIKYLGTPYEYGEWDCSQAIYQACLDVGVEFVDGSSAQKAATTEIPLETAPIGALGWLPGHDGLLDGAGGIAHAANKERGTVWDTRHEPVGIIYAGLIPGIDYTGETMAATKMPYVTTKFHAQTSVTQKHRGLDLRSAEGAPVLSVFDGTVVDIARNRGKGAPVGGYSNGVAPLSGVMSGDGVKILLNDGSYYFEVHLDPAVRLKVGDRVKAFETVLGVTNLSGQTYGAHRHLELWRRNVSSSYYDPTDRVTNAYANSGKDSNTGTNPTPNPPTEEDDMPYTPDELKQITAEGALQALNGPSGRAIIRELIREQTDPIARNAAAFMLGSWLGRGENRRTVAQAIASTDSDVEVILTMVKK